MDLTVTIKTGQLPWNFSIWAKFFYIFHIFWLFLILTLPNPVIKAVIFYSALSTIEFGQEYFLTF